jgi:hypothetical protein
VTTEEMKEMEEFGKRLEYPFTELKPDMRLKPHYLTDEVYLFLYNLKYKWPFK